MEKYGMLVLNGRTEGDKPGNFTFVTSSGKSTVDLVWVDSMMAEDVKQLQVSDKFLESDHLLLNLRLNIQTEVYNEEEGKEIISVKKYTWDEEKKLFFKARLNENAELENIYESLKREIDTTSEKLNLVTKQKKEKK